VQRCAREDFAYLLFLFGTNDFDAMPMGLAGMTGTVYVT